MKVYYLPGDLIMSLSVENKEFNKALSQLNKKLESLRIIMQPAISNMVKQWIEMAQRFDEQMQRIKIIELNQVFEQQDILSLKEFADSLKEIKRLEFKKSKGINLPKPVKCIRARKINNKIEKIIYYHIRSNC